MRGNKIAVIERWSIPKNWAWVPAGLIADVVGGGTPSANDANNFSERGIAWITPADLTGYKDPYIARGARDLSQKGYRSSSAQLLPSGSVLFSSRAPIGYCVIASEQVATNQGFKSFVLRGDIQPEFLRHYLRASIDYAESLASGTTFKEISGSRVAEMAVPIAPLAEQRRIIAKIDSLSQKSKRARNHLDCVPMLVKKYKQALLDFALQGKLSSNYATEANVQSDASEGLPFTARRASRKNKLKGFVNREGLEFPTLPQGWSYKTIHELYDAGFIHDYADGNHGSLYPRSEEFGPEGETFVTASQILADRVNFQHAPRLKREKAALLRKGWAQGGDVLLTHNATVGRVAVVDRNAAKFLLGTSVTFYRPEPSALLADYLAYCFRSPIFQRQLELVMVQTTRNQVPITKQAFLEIPFAPIWEQREIIGLLRRAFGWIDRLASEASSARKLIDHLDQAVLSKAFRGELVPQDPDEEPASVLLERIKAERAGSVPARRGRGRSRLDTAT